MDFEGPKQPKIPEDVFQTPRAQRINETTEEYRAANPEHVTVQKKQHQEKMAQAETKKEDQKPTPEQLKAQQEREQASQMVADRFIGKSRIPDGILTPDETQVLAQMEALYKQQKVANPGQPVQFGLDDTSNETYVRLLHRLPLAIQEHGHTQRDQVKADQIREKLGLEKKGQENWGVGLSEQNILKIKNEAGENYRKNNGDVNNDLLMALIDPEIGRNFDAHGIAKVNIYHQLDSLINLLQKGIDPNRPFHSAPLELRPEDAKGAQTVGGIATRNGSFIVLGEMGKSITESGIKHVLVNDAFYGAIEKLSLAFPQVEFIRADEANAKLTEIAKRKTEQG